MNFYSTSSLSLPNVTPGLGVADPHWIALLREKIETRKIHKKLFLPDFDLSIYAWNILLL